MLYTSEMIKNLGYESIEEFVTDYIKTCKNCCIQYTFNGVYLDYDFDSSKGVPNDEQPTLGSIVFPQTIGDITYYSSEELIEWVENQQKLNNIFKQEGYLKTQNTCSEKWGVSNYRFNID